MQNFQPISVSETKQKLTQQNIILIDIRDETTYQQNHIPGAKHLSNKNLVEFLQQTEKTSPIIVYCYHGHSSQSAAQFLLNEGFTEVYSMTGGFEAWLQNHPDDTKIN